MDTCLIVIVVCVIVTYGIWFFIKSARYHLNQKLDAKILEANYFISEMGKSSVPQIRIRYNISDATSFTFQLPFELKTIRKKRKYLKSLSIIISRFIDAQTPNCLTIDMDEEGIMKRERDCASIKKSSQNCNDCPYYRKRRFRLYPA